MEKSGHKNEQLDTFAMAFLVFGIELNKDTFLFKYLRNKMQKASMKSTFIRIEKYLTKSIEEIKI